MPATSVDLDDPAARLHRDDAPWPGAASGPAPATVLADPVAVELLDATGEVVRVTGRGELAAPPAVLVFQRIRLRVSAWAGPWPIEQRWWSPGQVRRLARVQVLTSEGDAYLLAVERGAWQLLAAYT